MNQILCIALALVVGLLSSRLMKLIRLPNVTGYLISGIIFGPFVLGPYIAGWVPSTPANIEAGLPTVDAISWISDIALGFIAFSIGSSFKLSSLKQVGPRVIIITICEALGGAIFVIGAMLIASIWIEIPLPIILTLGAIACATAPAATLMVVKQYKAKGPVVNTLLPVVAFDDAVALIAFAILFSISKGLASGTSLNVMDLLVWPLVEIAASIIIGTILGILVTLGCKLFKSRANRMIMCIAAILIAVGISQLPYKSWWGIDFSLSSLLTAMMIGAILVNFQNDADRTFERMEMFTPPIFMLFFVISGAELDLTMLFGSESLMILIIAGVYIVSRCIGKWAGAFFSSKATKAPETVQKYLGFALFPQAGVAIGLASTASSVLSASSEPETQKFGSIILAVILAATIVYEIAGPIITKIVLTKAGEISKNENKVSIEQK